MKRTRKSLFCNSSLILAGLLASVITVTACKSAPVSTLNPVKAFDVLDDDAALYISIPAKENAELLEKFIAGFKLGVSESDAKMIVSKLDRVYASFGSKSNKRRICVSAEANIPGAVTGVLKRNGYEEATAAVESVNGPKTLYKYYSSESIQMAFPSAKNVLISKNVVPLIKNYAYEEMVANGTVKSEEPYRQDWYESDLYKWLTFDTGKIHFYIVRPQSFLSNLLGSAVSTKTFKLNYAKGEFEKLPNSKYGLTLELNFMESRYIKPAISLLSLALGLTDSEIEQIDTNTVKLSGVHISSKQLIDMFGI